MANDHENFCHKIFEQFDSIEEDLGGFQNLFRKCLKMSKFWVINSEPNPFP